MRDYTTDLGKLNSMTKYPSIPTYHAIGERGVLRDEVFVPFPDDTVVVVTEKVDGVNGRIILLPNGDWLIGSREELLTARGDRVPNPQLRIVDAMAPLAEQSLHLMHNPDVIVVLYGEVYGANVSSSSRNYGSRESLGVRFFDVMVLDVAVADSVYAMPRDRIALWRDHGNQPFLREDQLKDLPYIITPRLGELTGDDVPTRIEDMLPWLEMWAPRTHAALDADAQGKSEGVVVRTPDRLRIAKIRYEDYQRTLRANQPKAGKR